MNKRTQYGNIITKALPYHVQIYALRQKQLDNRFANLEKLYYRNPAVKYKKNSFIRKQLECGRLLCYHCEHPLQANVLNVSNRKNMYHLKCAILIDLIPHNKTTIVTKDVNSDRKTLDYKPRVRTVDLEHGRIYETVQYMQN